MLHRLQLGRKDCAYWTRVHRTVCVSASLPVYRAGIQARSAANAIERIARFFVRENRRAAVIKQHNVKLARAVAGHGAGPNRIVWIHALAGCRTGQQLQKNFQILKRWDDLFNSNQANQHFRKRNTHTPVAFRFDDADGSRLCDREIRAADSDLHAQKLFTQIAAGRIGQIFRAIAEFGQLHLLQKDPADFHLVAMQCWDYDMGRPVIAQLHDEIRQIGFMGRNSRSFERGVQTYFIGGHGFDLDDLRGAVRLDKGDDNLVCFVRIAGPVNLAAGTNARRFKLLEICIQMPQRVLFDALAGLAELFPVRHLANHFGALVADNTGGVANVVAQLRIAEQTRRGFGKVRGLGSFTYSNAHNAFPSSVEARISARCRRLTPVRCRLSAPPMCMRQELSSAVHTSAPVSSTQRTLPESIAAETSAFLTANVPPNPQHSSASGRSIKSSPRTLRRSRAGLSPTCSERSEWQAG